MSYTAQVAAIFSQSNCAFNFREDFFFSFRFYSHIFRTDGNDLQLSVMVGMHEKCNYVCVASYNVEWLHVYLTLNHMAYMTGECVETSKFIVVCF